jgi:hypothetical protein
MGHRQALRLVICQTSSGGSLRAGACRPERAAGTSIPRMTRQSKIEGTLAMSLDDGNPGSWYETRNPTPPFRRLRRRRSVALDCQGLSEEGHNPSATLECQGFSGEGQNPSATLECQGFSGEGQNPSATQECQGYSGEGQNPSATPQAAESECLKTTRTGLEGDGLKPSMSRITSCSAGRPSESAHRADNCRRRRAGACRCVQGWRRAVKLLRPALDNRR